jgi:predicted RNA-binding protein YlxR (DUF448 family)
MELKKKIPQRRCVGCGETKDKKELIRVVRTPEGEVCLDFTGKKSGRGAYLCHNRACLKKARKTKRIEQNLDTHIPDEIYENLEEQLSDSTK